MNQLKAGIFLAILLLVSPGISASQPLAVSDFFVTPSISKAAISPDGQKIAFSVRRDKSFNIYFRNSKTQQESLLLDYKKLLEQDGSYLSNLEWIDDHYLAFAVTQKISAIAGLADTKQKYELFFVDTRKPVNSTSDLISIRTPGTLISPLPSSPREFLYAKNGSQSRVYRLDVSRLDFYGAPRRKTQRPDGGQFNLKQMIAKTSGYNYRWFLDGEKIVAANNVGLDGAQTLMETKDGGKTWEEYKVIKAKPSRKKSLNKAPTYYPVSFNPADKSYFAVAKQDEQPQALYRFSDASEEPVLVYQHSSSDLYEINTSADGQQLQSVLIQTRGEHRYIYFDDSREQLMSALRKKGLSGYLSVIDSSLDGTQVLVFEHRPDNPGSVYFYDTRSNRLSLLRHTNPSLHNALRSKLVVNQFERDALSIEYFLTLPNNKHPSPLVVIPHGGPVGIMDQRSFDSTTQLLANHGYAVLQVNYRGSAGYGQDFIDAGKREWGTGMLADIKAAVDIVKKRPDIKHDSICISGGSYGGYAALSMPIQYPGIFKCSAAFAAVTDVHLYTAQFAGNDARRQWLDDFVGNPVNDREQLQSISPVYNAEKLTIPVLLVHGDDDNIVDMEHFNRMAIALQAANATFEPELIPDLGHGFENPGQAQLFHEKLLQFLEKHLQ
jgi:dipeptidyl aminopeptidase/acylaminoacyl peptidase